MKPYEAHIKKSPVWDFESKGLVMSKSKKTTRQYAKKEIEKDLETIEGDLIKYDWAELDSIKINDVCKHCPSVHNAFCHCTLGSNIIY